jgi:hypothetical protein
MATVRKLFVANLANAVRRFPAISAIALGGIIGFGGGIWKIWGHTAYLNKGTPR